MKCPICCSASRVSDSRKSDTSESVTIPDDEVIRWRKCTNADCGQRFKTRETVTGLITAADSKPGPKPGNKSNVRKLKRR